MTKPANMDDSKSTAMLQTFEPPGDPETGRRHLAQLRDAMQRHSLSALFIPHADEYQNEYQPAACKRLAWATGFTGSAGAAIIFEKDAFVFVDGRYTLQAEAQLDSQSFILLNLISPGPFDWIGSQTHRQGVRMGYDPHILTHNMLEQLRESTARANMTLSAAAVIESAWKDRPPLPASPISPHHKSLAGENSLSKRRKIVSVMKKKHLDAVLIASPASMAWLFNLRGGDVACTPIALGRAILGADTSAELFLNPASPKPGLAEHLGKSVTIENLDTLPDSLSALKGQRIGLDPNLTPAWFFSTLNTLGAKAVHMTDPCALPRACKNTTEIAGAKQAHLHDGIALSRFLHWLSQKIPSESLTEIDVVKKLESFRRLSSHFRDLSFETIAGSGPNGAIIHYRVNEASNRVLSSGLFLLDSGGQYKGGTTDVTRTVPLDSPNEEMRRLYTLVLKGHVALAQARFPEGTNGGALDVLARAPLWQAGLDYDHGTGHGVGSFLSVHEGPQRITRHASDTPLLPGMILSNEPGYYRNGAFGIRIENLQYVTKARIPSNGDRAMMGFKPLTLVPYEPKLIELGLLDAGERKWLNTYHQKVFSRIAPHLDIEAGKWLKRSCAPL